MSINGLKSLMKQLNTNSFCNTNFDNKNVSAASNAIRKKLQMEQLIVIILR